ncbi:unnamed protein product [Plutella xylostella]|uniref:(diamondback moth) hypothetical protein n=1 Tax=Plutella xylostella TaxID=51655 RepID=A0A8S4DNV5_PLUXY|nr:unnamed protein product [Plutella xylostella]
MDTTPEEAAQVVALLQQGLSQRAVAAQLHLSQSAVSRVYRRFQETGAFNRRPRTGRHRCTSERDDRFIVSTSLRNRHLTGVDVQQELRRVRQVAVSEWTVRRRLKEANLTPKRPASGPKLTAGHRQARLQFAREHLDWSIAQWRSVLFTDECRVCLHGSDRRGRVYRRPGERFAQCCFAETVAYGGGSCMMWAGISLEGKTALVFVPGGGRGGGLTADRYITDILLGHVVPYAEFVGEDFVLMHDNARCHTARVSRQFLREKELRTMDWPALSPDLNPIEHLWDELKRRVRARNPVPASVDELKTALLEEWDGIPQETVKKLIRSMRNRLQAPVVSAASDPATKPPPRPVSKSGKWNAMHVRIAWEIYNHQQKEKASGGGGAPDKDKLRAFPPPPAPAPPAPPPAAAYRSPYDLPPPYLPPHHPHLAGVSPFARYGASGFPGAPPPFGLSPYAREFALSSSLHGVHHPPSLAALHEAWRAGPRPPPALDARREHDERARRERDERERERDRREREDRERRKQRERELERARQRSPLRNGAPEPPKEERKEAPRGPPPLPAYPPPPAAWDPYRAAFADPLHHMRFTPLVEAAIRAEEDRNKMLNAYAHHQQQLKSGALLHRGLALPPLHLAPHPAHPAHAPHPAHPSHAPHNPLDLLKKEEPR